MFCTNCGCEVENSGSQYCSSCGKELQDKDSATNSSKASYGQTFTSKGADLASRLSRIFKKKTLLAVVVVIVATVIAGFACRDSIMGALPFGASPGLRYIAFKKDRADRWGILDLSNGEAVIADEWKEMPGPVSKEGIFLVKNNAGLFEFYKVGKKPVRIGSEYKNAGDFNEGIAVVTRENESISFIDSKGNELLKLKEANGKPVEKARGFSQGLAAFQDADDKWGYVDKKGKVVIKAKYDAAVDFREGLAIVGIEEPVVQATGDGSPAAPQASVKKRRFSVIDKSGHEVIKLPSGAVPTGSLSEGLIPYSEDGSNAAGVFSVKGDNLIKPSKGFKTIGTFNRGVAAFSDGEKWGLINKKGDIIVRAKYDVAFPMNGLVQVRDRGKVGYLNCSGDEVIKPEYDDGLPFYAKNTVVKNGGSFTVINKKGIRIGKTEFQAFNGEVVCDYYSSIVKRFVESDYLNVNSVANVLVQKLTRQEVNEYYKGMPLTDVLKNCGMENYAPPIMGNAIENVSIRKAEKYAAVFCNFVFDSPVSEPIGKYNNNAKLTTVVYRVQFTNPKAQNRVAEIYKTLRAKFEKLGYKTDPMNSNDNMLRILDDQGVPVGFVEWNSNNLSFGLKFL